MDKVMDKHKIASEIALDLLNIGAIKLNLTQPFVWSSGWKSPIYCDNRLALSYPKIRTAIKAFLVEKIREQFPEVEAIAGVATAGIPQGVLVAEALEVPFLYVRSKPKGHGMENMIEGLVVPKQKVVVIEDLISSGSSSLKAIEALRKEEVHVLGLGAIFTYNFPVAQAAFENSKVPFFTLSNYDVLTEVAVREKLIEVEDIVSLRQWKESPEKWSPDSAR